MSTHVADSSAAVAEPASQTAPTQLGVRALLQDIREGRTLFSLAREHAWFIPAMALFAVLSSVFEGVGLTLIIPLVQSLGDAPAPAASQGYIGVLNELVASFPPSTRILTVLGLIFAAVVAKNAFSYASMTLLGVLYGRISHKLRTSVFERILQIPLAQVERQQAGKLLNTLNNETWRATDALNLIFVAITALATTVVFGVLLLLLSWRLALISFACLALIPLAVQLVARRAKRLSALGHSANEALSQQTWSTLNGLRTIHIFGQEEYEQGRFSKISDRVRSLFLKMALVNMTTGPITEIMVVGVLAVLILLVDAQLTSLSTLVAFIALLYRLQPKVVSLVAVQANLAALHASVEAVGAILQRPAPARASFEVDAGQITTSPISFRKVTFRYADTATPAIQNLTFDLPSRGVVAIVGPSGAGKSTLLDLLLGFQVPDTGEILIGGEPLTPKRARAWRQCVGVVSQDPYVFDDTVRANIQYGRPDADEASLIAAAKAVAADDFIRALPQGYDTPVGERATQLSGGQRQRIALARAVLRDPQLLILDEATNALDSETERVFQTSLARFARDRCVLVVAHKLSTVATADHVLVLQNGRLVEQGAPSQLLKSAGPFARMFGVAEQDGRDISLAIGGCAP